MAVQPSSSLLGSDLFYEDLIRFYTDGPHVVERPWLEAQIETALEQPDCRFLLLTADPGAGKTTLAAWLAYKHANWPRYFIRRDQRAPLGGVDAHSMLLQIGFQLAATYPALFTREQVRVSVEQRVGGVGEGGQLTGVEIEKLLASPFYEMVVNIRQQVERNNGSVVGVRIGEWVTNPRLLPLSALQYLALLDPARALLGMDPGARLVILIDALDELRFRPDQDSILKWLADSPPLPANVRFILTSRRDEMLDFFRQRQGQWINEVTIDLQSNHVRDDLGRYAVNFAAQQAIRDVMAEQGIHTSDFVEQAVEKAQGNFKYLNALARAIVQALETGEKEHLGHLLRLEDVPTGLGDLYAFLLTLTKQAVANTLVEIETPDAPTLSEEAHYLPAWEGLYIPILGILAVAQDSLTFEHIMNFAGVHVERTRLFEALGQLGQFLAQADGRYRLYHTTFQDFLTSAETGATYPAYYLDPTRWHRKIAAHYRGEAPTWEDVAWKEVDNYGLLNLSAHLYGLKDTESLRQELYGLICKSFMHEKYRRFGSHLPFDRDVALAIGLARSEKPWNLVQAVRACLIYATLGSQAANVPLELISALARIGRPEQAQGFVALLGEGKQRQQGYLSIAEALIERREIEEAQNMLMGALDASYALVQMKLIADGMITEEDVVDVLIDVAPLLGVAGAVGKVRTVIDELGYDQTHRDGHILSWLAESLAREGELESAVKVADLALAAPPQDVESQADLLTRVAQVLARAGERPRATETMQTVLTLMEQLKEQPRRIDIGWWVAPALAQAAMFTEALKIADKLNDSEDKANVLSEVAVVMAEEGEFKEALKVARRIKDKKIKEEALSRIARLQAEVGQFDEARKVAQKIENGSIQAIALSEIALTAALMSSEVATRSDSAPAGQQATQRTNDVADLRDALQDIAFNAVNWAMALLDTTGEEQASVRVQDNWVQVMYYVGKFDDVLAVAENITPLARKALYLCHIVELLEHVLDEVNTIAVVERALAAAEGVRAATMRAVVFLKIASVLALLGKFTKALPVAEKILEMPYKVNALARVAQAMAWQGEEEQAADVAVQVLVNLEAIKDETSVLYMLSSMVEALASAGQKGRAVEIAHWIDEKADELRDEERRAWALVAAARAKASIGEFARASEIAAGIGRTPIDGALADALIGDLVQEEDQALRMEAISAMWGVEYDLSGYRALALSSIALALVQSGQRAQGVEMAQQALQEVKLGDNEDTQVDGLSQIAQTLALAGDFARAVEVVETIPSKQQEVIRTKQQQIFAFCSLSSALARFKMPAEARKAANRALDLVEQGQFGYAALLLGNAENSLVVVPDHLGRQMKLDESWRRDEAIALCEVAKALALAGDQARALELANRALAKTESIFNEGNKADVLNHAASALIQAGAIERGEEVAQESWVHARKIEDVQSRARVLCRIASIFVSLGKSEQAQEALEDAMVDASGVNRETFLEIVRDSAPILPLLGQGEALARICDAVVEVEDWWGRMGKCS